MCGNCGGTVPGDQAYCPHCGFGPWESGWRSGGSASTTEKVVLGVLFVIVGLPAGLVGACLGLTGRSEGASYLGLGLWLGMGLVGVGVFALLLWLWVRSLKR